MSSKEYDKEQSRGRSNSKRSSNNHDAGDEADQIPPEKIVGFESVKDFDKYVKADFPKSSNERLDEDYIKLMDTLFYEVANCTLSEKHMDFLSSWLNKLLGDHVSGTDARRNRNIFITQLILQIREGSLSGIFAKNPPPNGLPEAGVEFDIGNSPPKKAVDFMRDTMFEAKDFVHVSKDGRTYLATKGLEDQSGACAYLAVTVGGGEPVWLDPAGKQMNLPETDNIPITTLQNEGTKVVFKTEKGLNCEVNAATQERRSKIERENLKKFYRDVIKRIDDSEHKTDCDIMKDKVLARLLDTVKCEIEEKGGNKEMCDIRVLLPAIRKKMRRLLKYTEEREKLIEGISEKANLVDDEIKFVDLSTKLAFDPNDDIWMSALREEVKEDTMTHLRNNYRKCTVDALLMLLERQRQLIIDQEKRNHDQIIAHMKSELYNEVRDGYLKYKEARGEWARVLDVLKDLEPAMEFANSTTGSDADARKAYMSQIAAKQLEEAKDKFERARQQGFKISSQIEKINCLIKDVQFQNSEAESMLKKDACRWTDIVNSLNRDLKAQEKHIKELLEFCNSRPGNSNVDCNYEG